MSEQEFESYLRLMGRFLKLNDQQRDAIKTELRDHMEERLDELMARGYSRDRAIEAALDEFGDAAAIASDFGKIGRRRKWIMRTATSTVGLAATLLIVSFLLPENRPSVPAPAYTLAQNDPPPVDALQPPAAEEKKQKPKEEHEELDFRPHRDRAILDKVLPSLDFQETPFGDVIDYLRDQIDMNVYVNRFAFEDYGISLDMPITLNLKDIPVEQALGFVLLEAAQGDDALAYAVKGNVLVISTKDELAAHVDTEVRIYDCRDLINGPGPDTTQEQARASFGMGNFAHQTFVARPQSQVVEDEVATEFAGDPGPASDQTRRTESSRNFYGRQSEAQVVNGIGLGAGVAPAQTDAIPIWPSVTAGRANGWPSRTQATNPPVLPTVRRSTPRDEQHRANEFVSMITSTIASESWQQNGGGQGSISQYDGFLIVRQTEPVHEEIDELLAMLREAVVERQAKEAVEPQARATAPPKAGAMGGLTAR